jgi:hypothetical protein
MPERRDTGGLAAALARNREGGRGFWNGVGGMLSATPIGRLLHGDVRGAWNATPAGMAVRGIRGLFGGGAPSGPAGTAMGAFGPTLGGYGGAPGQEAAPTWNGGTDWASAISGGGGTPGPWQGAPALMPGQHAGAANSAGAWNGGSLSAGGAQMMAPMKQSGIAFIDRNQAQ